MIDEEVIEKCAVQNLDAAASGLSQEEIFALWCRPVWDGKEERRDGDRRQGERRAKKEAAG